MIHGDPKYLISFRRLVSSILDINMPTKTRVLLYIKVILIDKEIVMNFTNYDLHQICNVTSILRFNDVKCRFKIANVGVMQIPK